MTASSSNSSIYDAVPRIQKRYLSLTLLLSHLLQSTQLYVGARFVSAFTIAQIDQ